MDQVWPEFRVVRIYVRPLAGLPTLRQRVVDSLGGTSRSPGTGTKGLSGYRLSVSPVTLITSRSIVGEREAGLFTSTPPATEIVSGLCFEATPTKFRFLPLGTKDQVWPDLRVGLMHGTAQGYEPQNVNGQPLSPKRARRPKLFRGLISKRRHPNSG